MKHCVFMFWLATLCLLAGCGKKETTTAPATNESGAGNPLTAPVDYLGAVGKAQQSATKTTATVGLQQAIQMFKVEEGRNPKDLQELVTEQYMPRLPDPPTGMKFDYDPETGQVKLVAGP